MLSVLIFSMEIALCGIVFLQSFFQLCFIFEDNRPLAASCNFKGCCEHLFSDELYAMRMKQD